MLRPGSNLISKTGFGFDKLNPAGTIGIAGEKEKYSKKRIDGKFLLYENKRRHSFFVNCKLFLTNMQPSMMKACYLYNIVTENMLRKGKGDCSRSK